jgi:hypothetical protein
MQYRRGVYRKRRIRFIIIASVVAFLLIFALFLIIGTALSNKTHLYDPDADSNASDDVTDAAGLAAAEKIQARALVLLTQDSSSLYSRVSALPSGTEAVCVRLNAPDGTLLYKSDVAGAISSFTTADNASRPETLFSTIQRRELYISAALEMTALSRADELLTPIMLSAYASMAAEVFEGGANDILFIAPIPSGEMTAEKIDAFISQLASVAKQTRELAPDACLGFALPDLLLSSNNSAEIIAALAEHFNYLAIDATNYGKEDPAEYLERKLGNNENADTQYYILRYGMRILLPSLPDKDIEDELIAIAEQYSSNNHNWQILP